MRKPIIAGNWKMNKTNGEAVTTIGLLKENLADIEDIGIVIAPPYTTISELCNMLKDSNIEIGAQNMHFEKKGAYTGEVSALMLKDIGCKWVIIGHSERRQYFGCTDQIVNKKIRAAVEEGLFPIVCIGETLGEREAGRTFEVLKSQLNEGLKDLSESERQNLVIAYEPVWAIGTGKTATPAQAQEAHKFIRDTVSGMYGEDYSQSLRILYGGSVKPDNITELMALDDVDGGLVGGASLDADSFENIVKFKKK
ncbi:triose-phosphate isomerase [Elusimicrobiota bacterium]